MNKSNSLRSLSNFQTNHYRTFILLLSFIVGIVAGFFAVLVKNSAHYVRTYLNSFDLGYASVLYPAIGILLTVIFVKYIINKPIGHGIASVLNSISIKRGKIAPHNIYSPLIASSLTIGFGGSLGLEGPTVASSSAWGSTLGQFFKLRYNDLILMIGCGAAGAMAALFKAPRE
ncbi:MAG: chloride channel protein, partial [Bacteroidales bacterium]